MSISTAQEALGLRTPIPAAAEPAIFGRRSEAVLEHQLYVSDLYKTERRTAAIPVQRISSATKAGPVLVELRIGGNGRGAMTAVNPPSCTSPARWSSGRAMANRRAGRRCRSQARRAQAREAAACYSRHYPGERLAPRGALVLGGGACPRRMGSDAHSSERSQSPTPVTDDDEVARPRRVPQTERRSAHKVQRPRRDRGFTRLGETLGPATSPTPSQGGFLLFFFFFFSRSKTQTVGLEDGVHGQPRPPYASNLGNALLALADASPADATCSPMTRCCARPC